MQIVTECTEIAPDVNVSFYVSNDDYSSLLDAIKQQVADVSIYPECQVYNLM